MTVFGARVGTSQRRCYSTDGTDAAQGKPSEGKMTAENQSKLDKANKLIEEATAKFEEEEFSKSLPMYKEALQLRKEALGDDHPDVGEAYHFVAEVLWGLGHYKEAEATLRTSLPIMSKHLGPKDKSVGSILKNICECRQAFLAENEDKVPKEKATKLLKDVLPLAREATEIAKAHATNENDENYLETLYSLGEIYIQLDRYAEALPAFERNLPRIEEKQGAQSIEALICLRNLASCYQVYSVHILMFDCSSIDSCSLRHLERKRSGPMSRIRWPRLLPAGKRMTRPRYRMKTISAKPWSPWDSIRIFRSSTTCAKRSLRTTKRRKARSPVPPKTRRSQHELIVFLPTPCVFS